MKFSTLETRQSEMKNRWLGAPKEPTPQAVLWKRRVRHPNAGVYLVGNRELGWYKIGLSKNIRERLKTLRQMVPFKVKKISSWSYVADVALLEQYLHRQFHKQRLQGEWFQLSQEDVFRCDELVTQYKRKQGIMRRKPPN